MKYYNTPYNKVLAMPCHRFFLLLGAIQDIEDPEGKYIKKDTKNVKKLESKEDFVSFFGG